jgi:hypothetical protein
MFNTSVFPKHTINWIVTENSARPEAVDDGTQHYSKKIRFACRVIKTVATEW